MYYREDCIGCNSCVENAPEFWEIKKEDGKAVLKDSIKNKNGVCIREIDTLGISENELAAKDCPVKIIKILK